MIPEWAQKHRKPGTTIKAIGNNYYLYYATSTKVAGKKYPVSKQTLFQEQMNKAEYISIYSDKDSIRLIAGCKKIQK